MHLSAFDYQLPEHLIARHPLPERAASRLLCLERHTHHIEHAHFSTLPERLQPNDLLVLNDTRVLPGRLMARKSTGGRVEILIERVTGPRAAHALLGSNRTPAVGSELVCAGGARAEIVGRDEAFFQLAFDQDLLPVLEAFGEMPLPPYLRRAAESVDQERYQTVYAAVPGAVAAPTAGLHFDQPLLDAIAARGVDIARVTLHVGAGTFQPVRVEQVEEHAIHAEWLQVSAGVCEQVRRARAAGGRVIAVGTTSMRALESAAAGGALAPMAGETRLFILPGYQFRVCDALITNFHLPKSTLLMLVSAFAGLESIQAAYAEAVREGYRFFSYGDAMFLYGGAA